MKRVVVTGGPCSGKTEALNMLRGLLADADISALFVPEAATDLIMEGIAPWTCGSMMEFQAQVAQLELQREDMAVQEALSSGVDLVIYDRGLCDGAAYLAMDEHLRVLEGLGIDHEEALKRYDAVFCLESLASGNPGAYTCANNEARTETAEEAAAVDTRIRAAWGEHPCFTFVPCEKEFAAKVYALFGGMMRLLEG